MLVSKMEERLLQSRTFDEAIWTILDDVIALLGAEYGNVQLVSADELLIVAQRGLSTDFLKTFRRVRKEDGSACGRALRLGKTVVIRDVRTDDEFAAFRGETRSTGFRSVQSTPIQGTDRSFLGMVSTHFANVHEPTRIEMEALKSYSIIAADRLTELLGDIALAVKAEQMNEQLYARDFSTEHLDTSQRAIAQLHPSATNQEPLRFPD